MLTFCFLTENDFIAKSFILLFITTVANIRQVE